MKSFLKFCGLIFIICSMVATFSLIGCKEEAQEEAKEEAISEETEEVAEETTEVAEGKPFEGITIKCTFISGGFYDAIYDAIPIFEEETGAKVEVVFKGNHYDMDKKIMIDFAAGTVDYDIFSSHSSFFTQYKEADGIIPLDDYFTEEELSDFIPAVLDAGRKDGNLWIIPRHFDVSGLHYRTDIFEDPEIQVNYEEEFGTVLKVPETWDEFKQVAIFLTDPSKGIYGTQMTGKEETLTGRLYEVLISEGGQYFDENWKPAFNSEAGVKAIEMFRDLYQAGAMPPGITDYIEDDVAMNWTSGIIAMYVEWHGWYSYFQDPEASQVAGKFNIARQPMGDAGIHGGWAGHHAFSVTKASENVDAAVALIKFLTNYDQQYTEAQLGLAAARNSVWDTIIEENEGSDNPLDFERLGLQQLQANEDYKTPPLVAQWIPSSDILYPILQAIILGDKEAKAGLDEAANDVEEIMSEAGYY